MNATTQKTCLDLLAGMPSSAPWTEASAALYIMALDGWSDDVALGAVKQACLTLEWRPAPVKLREIAVAKFAPAPSPYEVRQHLRDMLLWHGAAQAPRYEDKLPFLRAVADEIGGWVSLERMTTEEIDERFDRAYQRALQTWQEEAAESVLRLGEQERHEALGEAGIRELGKRGPTLLIRGSESPRPSRERGLTPVRGSVSWPTHLKPAPKDLV